MNVGIKEDRYDDEGVSTLSSTEQKAVEDEVEEIYENLKNFESLSTDEQTLPKLHKDRHMKYLLKGLFNKLSSGFSSLDASRPWIVYWIVHSLNLLGFKFTCDESQQIVDFLGRCQSPNGGFAGGPGQLPHLAPTYAAVNALVTLGTDSAYQIINRDKLYAFLYKMKQPDGGFTMHEGGEVDIRGIYCAISVARLTNICTEQLFNNTCHWIASCQTYEGGFSGAPGLEAHGGYTFCGLAALALLGKQKMCNTKTLLRWAVNRQMRFEGGFQGRTNKLVDGCYSFWQGGIFPILHNMLTKEGELTMDSDNWLFEQEALQNFLLICCQHKSGGLIDKPSKRPDFYHTCYTLSGMSIAQHFLSASVYKRNIVGASTNELLITHPLYNVRHDDASRATQYFKQLPIPQQITNEEE